MNNWSKERHKGVGKMKGEMLEDFEEYKKGQIVEVELVNGILFNYAIFKNGDMDWIPRSIVQIL